MPNDTGVTVLISGKENCGAFEPAGAEIGEGLVGLVERIARGLAELLREADNALIALKGVIDQALTEVGQAIFIDRLQTRSYRGSKLTPLAAVTQTALFCRPG